MQSLSKDIEQDAKLSLDHASVVSDAAEATKRYLNCTEAFERTLYGAIKVTHHSEIPAIMAFANRASNSIVLYPISTGNNWGYGTSLPNQQSVGPDPILPVVLDLSALCGISMVNPELGIVRVEPGVTQKHFHEFLKDAELDFMVPVTGAGNHCSIMGNALERGYGITPRQDHFAALTDLKAYLPDGTHYQSPIREILSQHAKTQPLENADWVNQSYKWNIGPYLDGLFTQSAFGVVYECTIRLKKRPAAFDSFYVSYYQEDALEQALSQIRNTLEEFEGIVGSINLMDKRRVISMVSENPNKQISKALEDSQVAQIAKQEDVPAWTIAGTIYGNPQVVKAVKSKIKSRFKSADRIICSSDFVVRAAGAFNQAPMMKPLVKLLRQLSFINRQFERLGTLQNGIEIMQGKPNEVAKKLSYWRNKSISFAQSINKNPAEDGCGLLWYAPLIPMNETQIQCFVEHVRSTCKRYNIDPMITFTNLSHDLIDSTIPILFDAQNANAVKEAHQCLEELVEKGLALGFVPYRLNIEQQRRFMTQDLSIIKVMKSIYEKVDINGILQRGRYGK